MPWQQASPAGGSNGGGWLRSGTATGQQLGPGLPQVVFSPTPLGRFLVQSASTPCHPVPLAGHPGSAGGLLDRDSGEGNDLETLWQCVQPLLCT